jgi:hypothetical protein
VTHLRETQEMVFDDNDGATYAQVVLENHEQAFCRM